MNNPKKRFIELIKRRSSENKLAIKSLFEKKLFGKCISTLREELDSFIRVMFLGRISNIQERERLMNLTLEGKLWNELTPKNKLKKITDRDMVEKSKEIYGYIHYVYKFGCSFIHLSDLHNYRVDNPFNKLDLDEINDIKYYLNQYHQFPIELELNVENISDYILDIFEKISTNMECYFDDILNDKMITV